MKKLKKALAFLLVLSLLAALPFPALAADGDKEKAAEKVRTMTLEQKLGQMLMPAFQMWTDRYGAGYVTKLPDGLADAIRELGFGGVALFSENAAGTAAGAALTADMQLAALSSEAGIPLLIAADQEGGYVARLGTGTTLCGNMALGAAGDAETARQAARILGSELNALGIGMDFAPVMDVNSNPSNPIIGVRSFSDDPALAAKLGSAFVEGLHDTGTASALKHFPGHGDTNVDSHTGLPCINKSLDELRRSELVPFRAGIEAGTDLIMTAHIQFPQIETETYISKLDGKPVTLPATLSKTVITGLLREEMGYDGVVSTDAMTMDAIAKHFDRLDAAKLAINAGVDILLMSVTIDAPSAVADCRNYISGIADMVRSGEIAESRIDEAVTRILTLKYRRGIMDLTVDKDAQIQRALSVVGSEANHEAEWKITEKAVTLVKNDGMLPVTVPEYGHIALFCSYQNEVASMEYAVSRLRKEDIIPESADCEVFCYEGRSASEFRSTVADADAVLASVETYREGNMAPGSWQAAFVDSLISMTHEYGKKIAVISIHLPYDLARYQSADALLAAYCAKGMDKTPAAFNGETATYGPNLPVAVCGVFGSYIPSGTLPVEIPAVNAYGSYTGEIRYPRGFGLTGFTDVPADSWYAPAVLWAVRNNLVTGVSPTEFAPESWCTRAQIVTLLWRAAGGPKVNAALPFTDVAENSWYADAVRWAVSMHITEGITSLLFGPDEPCTRAQTVTFLWRAAGSPTASWLIPYFDVPAGSWYADAVSWADAKGITNGVSSNRYGAELCCTRAQAVTFLYRSRK